jgi:hypothetical protein
VTRKRRPLKIPHPVKPPLEELFLGQGEGERLVHWLNAEPNTPEQKKGHERIISLLRLLAESVDAQIATGSKDAVRLYEVARPFYEHIRELLRPYSFTPDLRLTWQGTLLSVPLWEDSITYGDPQAVLAIDRLVRLGRFSALRRCESCGRWMFAKRPDNATCSARCRASKMRKSLSPERLAERREKARARYHFHKLRIAKRGKHGKR